MSAFPNPSRLQDELARIGFTGPAQMRLSPPPERGLILDLDGARQLLLVDVDPTPYRSVLHAQAAWACANTVPVPAERTVFGGRWILRTPATGAPATRPDRFAGIAWEVLNRLASAGAPRFGHRPGDGTFWPCADTWSDEVRLKAEGLAGRARRAGADETVIAGLIAWIWDRKAALDELDRAALVHGSLGPLQTRLAPDGSIRVVTDWSRAHFGDPLEDWVRYVTGPQEAVHAFVSALPGATPTPTQLRRLEAYVAVYALELLGEQGADPARAVQGRLAGVTQFNALKDGWVHTVFHEPAPWPERRGVHQRERVVEMLVESVLRCPPEEAPARLGALAACALAVRIERAGHSELAGRLWKGAAAELDRARRLARHLDELGTRHSVPRGVPATLDWIVRVLGPQTDLAKRLRTRIAALDLYEVDARARTGFVGVELQHRIDALTAEARTAPIAEDMSVQVIASIRTLARRPDVGAGHLPLFTALLALDALDAEEGAARDLLALAGVVPGVAQPGRTRVLFAVPSLTGWGELTLALRVAQSLVEGGAECWFSVNHAQLAGLQSQGYGVLPFPADLRGDALVHALKQQLTDFDAWVLVDLHLGGAALLDKGVQPSRLLDLGPPLVGIDTWDYDRIGQGLDISEYARSRVDPQHWSDLKRRLVPVPFAPLDTANGCSLLPRLSGDGPSADRVRADLGVGDRPLILLCTSWWQHEMMQVRETADVPVLLAHHLAGLEGDWRLLHVGPEPLPLREALGARYLHHRSMPAAQFEALVGAASVVLSLNASATTNTTAIATGTPVVVLVQRLRIGSVAELETSLGRPASDRLRTWVQRHAPVPRFAMWPMCMVEALQPLVEGSAYGELLNPTEILDEQAVQTRLRGVLYDSAVQREQDERRLAYLDRLGRLPRAFELFSTHLGLADNNRER